MYKLSLTIALCFYLPEAIAIWNFTGKALRGGEILKKYTIESLEGTYGAFSTFRNGTLRGTAEKVGVKLEDPNNKVCYLPQEVAVYEDLQKITPNLLEKGFANIFDYGSLSLKRVLIISRFSLDVVEDINKKARHYDWNELRFLAKSVIDELQFLHDAGWIHQDIKIDNLMYGIEDPEKVDHTKDIRVSLTNRIYMIDLGSATRFIDENGNFYKQTAAVNTTMGTRKYYPRTHRKGLSQSRRDDMEVLGFTLLRAIGITLPWEEEAEKSKPNEKVIIAEQNKLYRKPHVVHLCQDSGIYDSRIQRAITNYFILLKELFKDEEHGFYQGPDYEAFKKCFDIELGATSSSSVAG